MSHHFLIPELPPEPLWRVQVEEKRRPERVRASDAAEARRRIRTWLGYTPTSVARIEEDANADL